MKRNTVIYVLLVFLLANLLIFTGCSTYEKNGGLTLKESAVIMSNDVLSGKLNTRYSADINKEIYDFTGEFNYLYCYDEELDYYAIYNMNSGKIMERSNGNIFEGFFDYKCYYGGYGAYFYQDGKIIYSINDGSSATEDDSFKYLSEYSENLNQASIDDSEFKSRENIKAYVENVLYQDGTVISKCDTISNRLNNNYFISNLNYFSLTLCNSLYVGSNAVSGNKYCKLIYNSNTIGIYDFGDYDGDLFYDTLFPINDAGSCGLVAATMLLQYYERNQIVKTIPSNFYTQANRVLNDKAVYKKEEVLSEILHSELIRLNNSETGANFLDIRDTLKRYFEIYNLPYLSATTSIGYADMRRSIDNDEPCIAHIRGSVTFDILKNDLYNYDKYKVTGDGHVVISYGYTLDDYYLLDEFVCHTGWQTVNNFNSVSYISKLFIVGNVRLMY